MCVLIVGRVRRGSIALLKSLCTLLSRRRGSTGFRSTRSERRTHLSASQFALSSLRISLSSRTHLDNITTSSLRAPRAPTDPPLDFRTSREPERNSRTNAQAMAGKPRQQDKKRGGFKVGPKLGKGVYKGHGEPLRIQRALLKLTSPLALSQEDQGDSDSQGEGQEGLPQDSGSGGLCDRSERRRIGRAETGEAGACRISDR